MASISDLNDANVGANLPAMPTIVRFAVVSLVLLTAACGGSERGSDDGSVDSSNAHDARVDSGRDGSMSQDSGHDGDIADTGVDTSVSQTDSGPTDSGFDACINTGATATAAQVCNELCSGNVAMFCTGMGDGGCAATCLTAHADGMKTASQRGNILACTQAVSSAMNCGTFGACYSLASSCP
jgi:hypothetical protein